MARWASDSVGAKALVTVVIPVRDRVDELDSCLSALGDAAPVVVVDDGSADPAAIASVCERHGAVALRHESSLGPAAARNSGLAAVDTEVAALLDSDCTPPEGWLATLSKHFSDPSVGAVAPRIRPLERMPAGFLERFVADRSPLDIGPEAGDVAPGSRVSYVPTAALLVRRSALLAFDAPFDSALRYGEDIDFVWRLHDAGWAVRYDPSVTVRHSEPDSWRELIRRRRQYGTSAGPLAHRYPDRLSPLVVRPWPTLATLLALARRPRAAMLAVATGALVARSEDAAKWPPTRRSASELLQALLGLGRFATRICGPVTLLALLRRRTRAAALALLVVPPLVEWIRRRPRLDPPRWIVASVAEDVAFGSGVWTGCLRARSLAPLLPTFARGDQANGQRR